MKPIHLIAVIACAVLAAPPAHADSRRREAAKNKLKDAAKGGVEFSRHRATGAARFVRLAPGARGLGKAAAATAREKEDQSAAFFRDYGDAVGVSEPAGLRLLRSETDDQGETHLTYQQFHGDVPVFAGVVKVHFDDANALKAVTGTAIPDIGVGTTPARSADEAAEVALAYEAIDAAAAPGVGIGSTKLLVFREGLAQGTPGNAYLAWEVEVTDGAGFRDLVYVNAHNGKVIDRIAGIQDHGKKDQYNLYRRAYDGANLPNVPPSYPDSPFWVEGDAFPTPIQEANNMITSSKEVYDLFFTAFQQDSFDGDGAIMDAIFNRGYSCPNASWNGTFISFCPGFTTDDVTAHEWGHAFTQYTHGLIYQWQPGALNESYSDIWGEVVDLINGRGTDDRPNASRTAGACSVHSPPRGTLVVNSPASIAGTFAAQSAGFGPALTATGITGEVIAVTPANGCPPNVTNPIPPGASTTISPVVNPADGKIALISRGVCQFSQKVYNAQLAGYAGVIIANNAPNGLPGMGAGLNAADVTIPSVGVQQGVGDSIRGVAGGGVNATLLAQPGTDPDFRWLVGEDVTTPGIETPPGSGAIRDMWNPACYSNPGKVTDTAYYICDTSDNGGVHYNSGVPNHAFALIVDGGTFNGEKVRGIGLTKAAHIYYRAMTKYQVPDSDFGDHASALRASCDDLVGKKLRPLVKGKGHRGEMDDQDPIKRRDCDQVDRAIAAVELETEPTFCNFVPMLRKTPPPVCGTGTPHEVASFGFESAAEFASWTTSETMRTPADFTPRSWEWTSALPDGRAGSGAFGADPSIGTCAPGGDESGVLHFDSPDIVLPANGEPARLAFHHWVATELGYDGANVKVSVNGGPWLVMPVNAAIYNNFNFFLVSGANGNTNPMGCTNPTASPPCTASEPAWTGTDGGSVNGSWGQTIMRLDQLAAPGNTIRLRFDIGMDGCGGRVGWYVDDVQVVTCGAAPPPP